MSGPKRTPEDLEHGSFRDPSGRVVELDGRVLRLVSEAGRGAYEQSRDAGVLSELVDRHQLVRTTEVPRNEWPATAVDVAYVLEHERVPFVSYPYEWSFDELKAAAIHHLDMQLLLLQKRFVLSDASAYNVQFRGPKPIFIDVLSIRPYRDGEYWSGYRQFCEQFLNPLLLRAKLGVAHNAWFRGGQEGIPTADLARLLKLRHKVSWRTFVHVTVLARLEANAIRSPDRTLERIDRRRPLTRTGYAGLLRQLRKWVAALEPKAEPTIWEHYAATHHYTDAEIQEKRRVIADLVTAIKPNLLFDVGCNTGDFSEAALEAGAAHVIGFDFDHQAVNLAYGRAVAHGLEFLPLWLDATNPSPDQGWNQTERRGFARRAKGDALIALALVHHLAIGRNVPLSDVIRWLTDIAPEGIIEFVPKDDPMVHRLLALREDIFPDYSEDNFVQALSERCTIVSRRTVSASGRTLFHYQRLKDQG
jgi:ribosomal protein L11 methylase PrmA